MPYAMKRKGSKYQVVNTDTGKVHSTTSKAQANRRLGLLKHIERDWQATGSDTFTREVNGRRVTLRVK